MTLETISNPVTSARVSVRPPHDFGLYAKLGLSEHEGPLPFFWSKGLWSSLVETGDSLLPVQVTERMTRGGHYLQVSFYEDIDSRDLASAVDMISRAFCADIDLNRFYLETAIDERLCFFSSELRGLKPHLSLSPYEALIKAIIRQLVRAAFARESISLLVREFGRKRKLGQRVFYGFPTPAALAKAKKSDLLRCKVGFKWRLIRQISQDVACGDLDLDDLLRRPDEEDTHILEDYSGIGYWTSRIFLYDGLKRLNSYPIQDISLRRVVSELYFGGRTISWAEVDTFFEAWREWTGILVTYMFGYLWLKRLGRL